MDGFREPLPAHEQRWSLFGIFLTGMCVLVGAAFAVGFVYALARAIFG